MQGLLPSNTDPMITFVRQPPQGVAMYHVLMQQTPRLSQAIEIYTLFFSVTNSAPILMPALATLVTIPQKMNSASTVRR